MPNLGFSSATGENGIVAGQLTLSRFQATENGTISSISGRVRVPGASYAQYMFVVYTDNSGAPGSPLDWSAAAFDTPSAGVATYITKTATQGAAIVAGNYYHIGIWLQHDSAYVGMHTADSATYRDAYYVAFSGTPSSPPASVGARNEHRPYEVTGAYITYSVAASGPTISSGTPTGTTTATPTLGFTTDANSGTARIVVDSAANLSGVTATQVLAGQKASGAAAAYATGTLTVSGTTVTSTAISGLPPGTYTAAAAQNDGANDSNVLTWTFTVPAYRNTSVELKDLVAGSQVPVASKSLNWWLLTAMGGASVENGTKTTTAGGVLSLTGLSSAAGSYILVLEDPADNTYSQNYRVTLVEA